ncbi:MAG: M24 family metallopeptidase C-terminal domain-containing protein, partial [Alphaproteobacteria bacterium]|nr:M24 family metallopeptidase C-terminal domain-containing protein [Alphaproteobacteria bacterium]
KGHIALGNARFPEGTSGHQLDAIARYPLWQEGLDYDHGTGHGVGCYLNVHEGPQRISKAPNNVALRKGMILSNEPGYYVAGEYGIRIENLVAVQESGNTNNRPMLSFETLTYAPIDRHLIDKNLLTQVEIDWVNDYHTKVYEKLNDLVDADTKIWLKGATAKI